MTKRQTLLYFRLWNDVRRVLLRQGVTPAAVDGHRHDLHEVALGYQRSSKEFTNAELDKVLAHFRAIAHPDDLTSQLDAQQQARKRKLFVLDGLCRQLGVERSYAEGIVRRMNSRGSLAHSHLDDLDDAGLRKALSALNAELHRRRAAKASDCLA